MADGGVCSNPPYVGKNLNSILVSPSSEELVNTLSLKGLTRDVSKAHEDSSMARESVKPRLTIYASKPIVTSGSVLINSNRCQNMTIGRKNRKKDPRENILVEEEKELLLEAGYIPIYDGICMAEEGGSNVTENNRALRAQNPILEVLE